MLYDEPDAYENIIVSAYWFSEGGFWVFGALGYNGEAEPVEIEVYPNSLDCNEVDAIKEMRHITQTLLLRTNRAIIHLNGNELETVSKDTD